MAFFPFSRPLLWFLSFLSSLLFLFFSPIFCALVGFFSSSIRKTYFFSMFLLFFFLILVNILKTTTKIFNNLLYYFSSPFLLLFWQELFFEKKFCFPIFLYPGFLKVLNNKKEILSFSCFFKMIFFFFLDSLFFFVCALCF